jgi:hypothetical protein
MRFQLLLLVSLFLMLSTKAQNSVNYSAISSTTGSLTDMSSGTTQLIGSNNDDASSPVTNLNFDLFFMGTRYVQFSVNSNGTLRLGATAINSSLFEPLGTAGQALITAYGADQRTHPTGKVHYKVTGTTPNRVLIVEWLNMQSVFGSGGTADLTYQVRLYETTGVIELVYGSMTMSAGGAADLNCNTPHIGFSSGNVAGAVGSFSAPFSGTPAPSYISNATTAASNTFTAGNIPVLSSVANGARRIFQLTPPTTTAPSALSFTGISATGMTLNWTDNATNEVGYAIYNSTDGINYNFVNQAPANATSSAQTALFASTTYYWKVVAFTEGSVSNAVTGSQATPAPPVVRSNGTGGGLWSNTATWTGGVLPTSSDSVVIGNGDVVTIDMTASAYSVNIGPAGLGGTLQFEATTARTISVVNVVTIGGSGIFRSATTGTQTGHNLTIGGNITNDGIFDFSNNGNTAQAGITFTGPNNSVFSGGGGTTDIAFINVNKTATTNIVELMPGVLTVQGSAIDNVPGFLTMTNGIFKISGSFTYTGKVFSAAAYTIPATFGVWLNNPNFTIAAQNANVINSGVIRISNGTWNMGTSSTGILSGNTGASFIVEGGTLNIAGRFIPSTAVSYNQSGGIVNVAAVGNSASGTTNASFYLQAAATFTMSGGTINMVQACTGATPADWNVLCTVFNYTGGTLQAGTGATTTNFNFRIRSYAPGLTVNNTTNNKTVTIAATTYTYGNVLINSGTSLVSSGQTWGVAGPSVVNNGTITITGAAALGRMLFMGTVPQTYSGSGTTTITTGTGNCDLGLNNSLGLTIDPASNGIITQRVDIFTGGITNANKITLGTGGTNASFVQYGNAGSTNSAGNFDVAPIFNLGSGGLGLLYLIESTPRTTGSEIPADRNITSLNLNNPNGLTITGGDLTISAGATPTLSMIDGNITTGSNTLTLGTSAALPGTFTYTSGTIVGKFKRWLSAATGARDFPVGIASAKRTASIDFTTAPTTGGTLTAEWVAAYGGITGLPLTEGANTVSTTCNDGYWRIVAGDGLNGGVYTATLTATGISQVTDVTKLVLLKRANGSSPWLLNGTHVNTSGTLAAPVLSRTGMSGFSEFGIGSDEFINLPVNLLSFAARKTGSSNELTWTTTAEQNNLGFEVQRSVDGFAYTKIGFVYARSTGGNSITNLNYNFTDNYPTGTVQYYRLRQVDINGQSKYSTVVIVRGDAPDALAITGVYPNPAVSVVNVQYSTQVAEKLSVLITDLNGRPVLQQTVYAGVGNNTLPLNVTALPKGTYFIKLAGITSHQTVQAVKVIKQ